MWSAHRSNLGDCAWVSPKSRRLSERARFYEVHCRAHPGTIDPMLTVLLLIISNTFMTFAWYGHLKHRSTPLATATLVSWLIALGEYCFQVPANRLGYGQFTGYQLKIIQEAITLVVFVIFAYGYLGETRKWNYLVSSFSWPSQLRSHSGAIDELGPRPVNSPSNLTSCGSRSGRSTPRAVSREVSCCDTSVFRFPHRARGKTRTSHGARTSRNELPLLFAP